ncbi:MAG: putative zinc-binding protein [Pseudomonadota bacterium]
MSSDCCASNGNIMILPCSGGSNTGQMANQAAVELTQEGFGKIYCLAGIGGRLSGFVQSAKDVEQMIVIDGCDVGCGKAVLEGAGVTMKTHLTVTSLGIEKNKNFNLKPEDVAAVKHAVKLACKTTVSALFEEPIPPSALPRLSGPKGGCCCGS